MNFEDYPRAFTAADLHGIYDIITVHSAGLQLNDTYPTWAKTIAAKLVPLSSDISTPKNMLTEWIWDKGAGIFEHKFDKCKLCGHSPIKYSFKIKNLINDSEIYCGSSCVLYFLGLCNKIIETDYDIESSFRLMTKLTNELKEKQRRSKIIEVLHSCDISYNFKTILIDLHSKQSNKVLKLTPKQANIAIPAMRLVNSEVASSIIVTLSTKQRKSDAIMYLDNIIIALSGQQIRAIGKYKK